jgi:hypothetical protein
MALAARGLARSLHHSPQAPLGAATIHSEEIEMNTISIEDLPTSTELERDDMAKLAGGRGRTPQQILVWELTGQPATWNGLVLGDDGSLHFPAI